MGGSLTEQEIVKAKHISGADIFVETGTYKADTCIAARAHFQQVYTIEISNNLWNDARRRAAAHGYDDINFILGDSSKILAAIAQKTADHNAVWFLDAHKSGHDSSSNGDFEVPLLKEIDAVIHKITGRHTFILDDVRFWKGKSQQAADWQHVSIPVILKKFSSAAKVVSFEEENDRLWVVIEK